MSFRAEARNLGWGDIRLVAAEDPASPDPSLRSGRRSSLIFIFRSIGGNRHGELPCVGHGPARFSAAGQCFRPPSDSGGDV